jgi:hypothetical protein
MLVNFLAKELQLVAIRILGKCRPYAHAHALRLLLLLLLLTRNIVIYLKTLQLYIFILHPNLAFKPLHLISLL